MPGYETDQRRLLANPDHASREPDLADSIQADEEVALVDAQTGDMLAVMQVHEKYSIDKQLEAEHVYRTADPKHPGVAKVLDQGDVNLAGRVRVLSEGEYPVKYADLYIRLPSRGRCFLKGAGRVSLPSRPEIPCTAATSTW